jgi:hypothetical protein
MAQDKDSVAVAKKSFAPTGIRVGADVLAMARTGYDKTFKGYEISGDIDLSRYYPTIEYGYWGRDYNKNSLLYSNDGHYLRVGVDVNFLLKDPEKNMFFLGARYGRSIFSESMDIKTTDPVWGDLVNEGSNNNATAGWFELTTGIRVKMWKMIWMGYTAHYKFGLSTNNTSILVPHDVPGFGRTDKEATWGFNYQVLIMLPIRKEKTSSN